jgi:hypothetical protein
MIKERMFFYTEAARKIITIEKFNRGQARRKVSVSCSLKREKGFQLTIKMNQPQYHKIFEFGKSYKKIPLTIKQQKFFVSIFFHSRNLQTLKGDVRTFKTKGYSEKSPSYHRLLIPITQRINLFYHLETVTFQSDYKIRTRNGTEITIDGQIISVNIFEREFNAKKYFFIAFESTTKQSLETFKNKAYAASISIGFFAGYFAAELGYYFQYRTKKMERSSGFYYEEMRSSVIGHYTPTNSNVGAYAHSMTKAEVKRYSKKKLINISKRECSLLSQKIHDNSSFAFVIVLLLEASSSSLLIMPSGFAICLETLHTIIMEGKIAPFPLISDAALDIKIKDELVKVINEHKTKMIGPVYETIISRIKDYNRATNLNRLKAPFDYLGLKLSSEDLSVLKTRNNFLHGTVPDLFKKGNTRSQTEVSYEMYYISLRYYTLLNMLILKWIGFNSFIINHPYLQRKFLKIPLKEEPYRLVI